MTYIIAGATGTTGKAIATEIAKTDTVHIIGRNEVYKTKKIDKSFPKLILENLEKYKDWISN